MNRGLRILAFFLLFVALIGCSRKTSKQQVKDASEQDSTLLQSGNDSLVIELIGEDSLSVFEILKMNHEVEYKSSLVGVFVTAIDSVRNSRTAFWVYSVNDSMPQVGCDRYVTKSGDVIKWHFRKMKK